MLDDDIIIKGNKDGINAVINMNKFKDFEEMMEALMEKLSKGRLFYKGATFKITTELKYINSREFNKLKDMLFNEFMIKDCILEEIEDKSSKLFNGINEGRTKFLRRTVRSGEIINYPGNMVVIGDVNAGSEITARGNVIVLGSLRGTVHAGEGGNSNAIVAAFCLQPEILKIADLMTRSPEDSEKPEYPEVARIKGESIIVEPYLPNKFL